MNKLEFIKKEITKHIKDDFAGFNTLKEIDNISKNPGGIFFLCELAKIIQDIHLGKDFSEIYANIKLEKEPFDCADMNTLNLLLARCHPKGKLFCDFITETINKPEPKPAQWIQIMDPCSTMYCYFWSFA